MNSPDPLKSVTAIENQDDTSLALPSENQYGSGAQRVKDQVQSIKRTKSRHLSTRSGSSSMSPTSPLPESNGSVSLGNGFFRSFSSEKNVNNYPITNNFNGSTVMKNFYSSRYERGFVPVYSMGANKTNTSRSEPGLAWQHHLAKGYLPPQRLPSNNSTHIHQKSGSHYMKRSTSQVVNPINVPNGSYQIKSHKDVKGGQTTHNHTHQIISVPDGSAKTKVNSGANGNIQSANITMKEAVNFLHMQDENYQLCGASYIQHTAFTSEKAKDEVVELKGILPLVALLSSSNPQIQITASAALRNLSYQNSPIKQLICDCDGISKAVELLKVSKTAELDKQVTGFLWNLSSADSLKPTLIKHALPALMEHVVQPYAMDLKKTPPTEKDSDAFLYATGCLRNLSSSRQNSRQAMRKHKDLIDSLVTYIKHCVDNENGKDKSLKNCVCILHNLTFQLEAEVPAVFNRLSALGHARSRNQTQNNDSTVGCFSAQHKPAEQDYAFDYPVLEESRSSGAGLLIHSTTLQNYLSLLQLDSEEETQEACCGAMQNLTSNEGIASDVLSQMIVKKLQGLKAIAPLLLSHKANLQRTAMILILNFMKNPNLHKTLSEEVLNKLIELIKGSPGKANDSDDTLAMACQSIYSLLLPNLNGNSNLLNKPFFDSLERISRNSYFPKSKNAASILLMKMWSNKDLQMLLKRKGMTKSFFVNDETMAAYTVD